MLLRIQFSNNLLSDPIALLIRLYFNHHINNHFNNSTPTINYANNQRIAEFDHHHIAQKLHFKTIGAENKASFKMRWVIIR